MVGDGAAAGVRFGAGDGGDLRGFGVDLDGPVRRAGRGPAGRRLPLAHTLGAWLLDEAGFAGTRVGVGPADLGQLVRDLPGPVGVLAMGDGSARRTVKAPGYLDDAAGPFDAAVAAALAAGDAAAPGRARPGRGGAAARRRRADLAGGGRGAGRPRRHRPPAPTTTRPSASATSSPTGSPRDAPPPVVAVVGPTATGKTALAVALAQRLGGEVVNADSMQLYRGMDIGTAKPDLAERGGVPHHLLDLWHVREPASVAEYRERARAEIDRLRAAGVVPLLVGGSGLYVRAVLDELDFPGTDAARPGPARGRARRRRPRRAARAGWPGLDPAAAAAVLPSNGRRIVRALEVIELTGGPFRAPAARTAAALPGRRRRPRPRAGRARRADRRCGWTACGRPASSTRSSALAADGLREGPTASRALGYAQVLAQFDGELTAGRGARADGLHHPAVRPPPAVVVPPRRGAHLVRRRRAPDLARRRHRA